MSGERTKGRGRDAGREGKDQVLEFWSGVMRDGEQEMKDRIKASENLAKALSLFDAPDAAAEPSELRVKVNYGTDDSEP